MTQSNITSIKHLLYQYQALYEQWQSDRADIMRKWQQFMDTDQDFRQSIERFKAISSDMKCDIDMSLHQLKQTVPQVKQSLEKLIDQSSHRMANALTEDLMTEASKAVNSAVSALVSDTQYAAERVNDVADAFERISRWGFLKTLGISVATNVSIILIVILISLIMTH